MEWKIERDYIPIYTIVWAIQISSMVGVIEYPFWHENAGQHFGVDSVDVVKMLEKVYNCVG